MKSHLDKNPALLKNYNNIINDYLNQGIIEPVIDNDTSNATHYLPRRPMIRKEKDTTKVKIVYDASAKTSGQYSLNETLHSGPCLLPIILEILLRFRLAQVALISDDIRQAFLQIEIDKLHRDYLRFMWHTIKVPMPAHGFKSSDWSVL